MDPFYLANNGFVPGHVVYSPIPFSIREIGKHIYLTLDYSAQYIYSDRIRLNTKSTGCPIY